MSSSRKIDKKIILQRDGQSQADRNSAELDPTFAPFDSKTEELNFQFIKEFSKQVNYYDADSLEKNGTWDEFFDYSDEELKNFSNNKNTPAHLALMQSFIRLMESPKNLLNKFTKRHLDFYYQEVLKLSKLNPQPDKAHVLFELKKNTNPYILEKGKLLNGGKDEDGNELKYSLQHDLVVNHSKVESIKSLYSNPENEKLYFAPVANSADGLGEELDQKNPVWKPFRNPQMPEAQIGFCLASAVLFMKEGDREISITLNLSDLSEEVSTALAEKSLLQINITGEDGWISTKPTKAEIKSRNKLYLVINISNEEKSIVKYNKDLHGGNYETEYPILQVLINPENNEFYSIIKDAGLISAEIEVDVKGVTDLRLENDHGLLDPNKPFLPFGPVPERGSNFYIGFNEAFSKTLEKFTLNFNWKNIPESKLADHYTNYKSGKKTIVKNNSYFSANVSIPAGGNWNSSRTIQLFDLNNAMEPHVINFSSSSVSYPSASSAFKNTQQLVSVMQSKALWAQKHVSKIKLKDKVLEGYKVVPQAATPKKIPQQRKDFMVLSLENGFLHKEYRELTTTNLVKYLKGDDKTLDTLKEPLAPEMETLTLDYKASSGVVSFKNSDFEDFAGAPIELFHVGAFGEMREHSHQRNQFNFVNKKTVNLFPQYNNEGEMLIGISGIKVQDSVSLLIQVAEGSSNPDKDVDEITWSVLCDNYWKKLDEDDIVSDDTMNFLKSGIFRVIIPKEATATNTILPEGLIWLKASVQSNTDAVCDMINIHSNAAIVEFENNPDSAGHLAKSLPAESITKFINPVSAIKSISQPYASFGGKVWESDNSFYMRVSERLKHKNKAINLWDYERMILQEFSNVYKVKCINHASVDSFYAPGHISLVLIPDLSNKNAVNRLQPKVDKATIKNVEEFLSTRTSSWVNLHVMNPEYEEIKLVFSVKFKQGVEFNNYRPVLNQDIISFLSPWVSENVADVDFGGKIHKSVIIKHIESLEYVDYISDIKLYKQDESKDREFVEASNPRSILVSSPNHEINSI